MTLFCSKCLKNMLEYSRLDLLVYLRRLCHCMCSTMFLMGPLKQLAKMFEKGRIVATAIYLSALGLTLWAALKVHPTRTVLLGRQSLFPACCFACLLCACEGKLKLLLQLKSDVVK